MFNGIIIIKLFYNVIFLFITTLSQDMFKVYFCFIFVYLNFIIYMYAGAYAGFLKGGGPNFKISGILDIHAAKRHVASSEAASLC